MEVFLIRSALVSAALVGLCLAPAPAVAAAAGQAAQVTAAEAAPFLGDWTLALQGQNGPATFNLAVKVEKDKVVGEIGSDAVPAQAITDISKNDKNLVLSYTFQYQGMPINTVVTLTPKEDGKTAAQIDFAGGAYIMTGSATKKETAK